MDLKQLDSFNSGGLEVVPTSAARCMKPWTLWNRPPIIVLKCAATKVLALSPSEPWPCSTFVPVMGAAAISIVVLWRVWQDEMTYKSGGFLVLIKVNINQKLRFRFSKDFIINFQNNEKHKSCLSKNK